jgi:ADP-heptose:LPS heptosyltransferase
MSPASSERSPGGRLAGRLRILPLAVAHRFLHLRPRERPAAPERILIAHHLLLGDTLMLTPLLAKLRERHPLARVVMTVRRDFAPLYSTRPYGVEPMVFEPRDALTLDPLLESGGFDLAYVPGDNRYSWLAAAAGARWIVAHAGDRPAYKSWPADELRPYASAPAAWADMVAMLAEGPAPSPFRPGAWQAPQYREFEAPRGDYCVLHLGASTPLKHWPAERWATLADWIAADLCQPVLSVGRNEQTLIDTLDRKRRFRCYAGSLDLAQLWQLLAHARFVVTLDTGVAHLAKIVGVPTVCLYGPGSTVLVGRGEFWKDAPFQEVSAADFPCRDQRLLFKRSIPWVRRCGRSVAECASPRCMEAIALDEVRAAVVRSASGARGNRTSPRPAP